ncbi:MAG: hypothetical protein JJE53_01500 [Candidatus Pacebacteria bacterium]|nr:hypothetical protein [Candidatus Paceibacterota bacterium]
MNENEPKSDKSFNVETLVGPQNSEVSFCPNRGGIITSLKLNGKEILYLDKTTFEKTGVSVRGGIPILFPNAGPITNSILPQHGFARNLEWNNEVMVNGFKETLSTNDETKLVYPYNFKFTNSGKFKNDGSFTIYQEVQNLEDNKSMPISMGLHPYFKVPDDEKINIKFNFRGGKIVQDKANLWMNGEYISIDNPKVFDPEAIMEIIIPSLGTLMIDASIEYRKIWIWSLPGKDFICIEPVMRDINGLIDDPQFIEPNKTFTTKVSFKLI